MGADTTRALLVADGHDVYEGDKAGLGMRVARRLAERL
jgi:hypothetical protein